MLTEVAIEGLLPFCLAGAVLLLLLVRYLRTGDPAETVGAPLHGALAEVTVAVPERGTGQVALAVNGSRVTLPARSASGRAIERGGAVVIVEVAGHVACVEELGL
jgi:hypothetical protein